MRQLLKIFTTGKRSGTLAICLLSVVASFLFYLFQLYSWNLEQQSSTRFFQQSFNAAISQYEYLPALLARDNEIKLALSMDSQTSAEISERFKFIAARSGASAVYLMKASGTVIATSNFDLPGSFLNKNYSFRPYFERAIATKKRQFYYAIGATTGIPGFFISEPILGDTENVIGVMVVKLDLREWEANWNEAGQNILIASDNNVVILSGQDQWRYRSIGQLAPDVLENIRNHQQFGAINITELYQNVYQLAEFTQFPIFFWMIENELFLVNSYPVADSNWTLYYLEKNSRFITSALIFLLILLSGLIFIYLYYWERKLKLQSRQQTIDSELRHSRELESINESLEEQVENRTRALRDTQAELVQQSKAAALGQMAATVVHELSQPLSAMNSSIAATRLKLDRKDLTGADQSVSRLIPLSEKMNNIVKLLKFYSYRDDAVERLELAPLIKQSLQMCKEKLVENNITISLNMIQDAVYVRLNPLKLDLVIVNIIQNAIDSMENCENPGISIGMLSSQDKAIITIEDEGEGINSRVMGQLFDPYFTTKEIGKGLGLGLSICYEIIREYNGSIVAENRDKGARFIISLPMDSEVPTQDIES